MSEHTLHNRSLNYGDKVFDLLRHKWVEVVEDGVDYFEYGKHVAISMVIRHGDMFSWDNPMLQGYTLHGRPLVVGDKVWRIHYHCWATVILEMGILFGRSKG